jgi:hypothetical protein
MKIMGQMNQKSLTPLVVIACALLLSLPAMASQSAASFKARQGLPNRAHLQSVRKSRAAKRTAKATRPGPNVRATFGDDVYKGESHTFTAEEKAQIERDLHAADRFEKEYLTPPPTNKKLPKGLVDFSRFGYLLRRWSTGISLRPTDDPDLKRKILVASGYTHLQGPHGPIGIQYADDALLGDAFRTTYSRWETQAQR